VTVRSQAAWRESLDAYAAWIYAGKVHIKQRPGRVFVPPRIETQIGDAPGC